MGPMPIPSSKAILRGLAENLNPHAPAPTIADLAAWLPRSPVEVWQAFGLSFVPITSGKPDRLDRLVIDFHETYVQWCQETSQDMKAAWREHPALVFVAGWPQRAVVVKPTRGAGLPRFQRMSEAEALALPGFDAQRPGPVRGQPMLPGFDVTPVGGCPSWLLSLYDQAGGDTGGRVSVVAAVALRPSRRGHRPGPAGARPSISAYSWAHCCPYRRPRATVATCVSPSPLGNWRTCCIPTGGIGRIAGGIGNRFAGR